MASGPVLVLGGTSEAREVADALDQDGQWVVSSMAGRIASPKFPAGEVRVGGFGGAESLAEWLEVNRCAAVIDASHPFAVRISKSAVSACGTAQVPLVRLNRPGWVQQPEDRWYWVDDIESAAVLAPRLGNRILLTIGRQYLNAFQHVSDAWFLVRCVDPPTSSLSMDHELLLSRGPFTLDAEMELIQRHRIDLIVTRDSGGAATEPKLLAARARGLPVVIVRRPPCPDVPTVSGAPQALAWLRQVAGRSW